MSKEYSFESILEQYGRIDYSIKGISMLPLIRQDRDVVTIFQRPKERLKKYDIPLFKRDNGEYVIHRILEILPNGIYGICGDNQAFIEYVREDQILGYIYSISRGKTIIPVSFTPSQLKKPLLYVVYVHVWCDLFFLRALLVKIEYRLRRMFLTK